VKGGAQQVQLFRALRNLLHPPKSLLHEYPEAREVEAKETQAKSQQGAGRAAFLIRRHGAIDDLNGGSRSRFGQSGGIILFRQQLKKSCVILEVTHFVDVFKAGLGHLTCRQFDVAGKKFFLTVFEFASSPRNAAIFCWSRISSFCSERVHCLQLYLRAVDFGLCFCNAANDGCGLAT
jgi:hypothetical protein